MNGEDKINKYIYIENYPCYNEKINNSEIPKEKYENIFKGAYERPEKYVEKNKTRKIKKNYK